MKIHDDLMLITNRQTVENTQGCKWVNCVIIAKPAKIIFSYLLVRWSFGFAFKHLCFNKGITCFSFVFWVKNQLYLVMCTVYNNKFTFGQLKLSLVPLNTIFNGRNTTRPAFVLHILNSNGQVLG